MRVHEHTRYGNDVSHICRSIPVPIPLAPAGAGQQVRHHQGIDPPLAPDSLHAAAARGMERGLTGPS